MKKSVIVTLLLLLCAGCTGLCEENSEIRDTSVVLIAENCENFPEISGSEVSAVRDSDLTGNDYLYDACYCQNPVYVIVNDSVPGRETFTPSELADSVSDVKRKKVAEQDADEISSQISLCKADDTEIDTLRAFTLAGSYLQSQSSEVKVIYAFISGRITSGLLNMTEENLLDYNPEDVASQLESLHALPELAGVKVIVAGLGEVSSNGNQPETPASVRYKLQNFLKCILEASGAETIFVPLSGSGDSQENLPQVSQIFFTEDRLDMSGYTKETFKTSAVRFDESELQFWADSAELKDRDEAKTLLAPVAELLKADPSFCITVAGSTASSGSEENCRVLAEARAETVKNMLIESGAPESQIDITSLGRSSGFPRISDLDENGNLTANAELNRAVFIYASDSEIAESIRERL